MVKKGAYNNLTENKDRFEEDTILLIELILNLNKGLSTRELATLLYHNFFPDAVASEES